MNITMRYKLFLKWTILVWLNAAFSFYVAIGEHKQPADILGIICGVFTFVALYTVIDSYLIKIKANKLRKSLAISVVLKALTQCYPVIELATGLLSTAFIQFILSNHNIPFISPYLITLTDGILLSIVVALLLLIVSFIIAKVRRFNQAKR